MFPHRSWLVLPALAAVLLSAGGQVVRAHRQSGLTGGAPRRAGPGLVDLNDRAGRVQDGRLARQRRQDGLDDQRARLNRGRALHPNERAGAVLGEHLELLQDGGGPRPLRGEGNEGQEPQGAVAGRQRDGREGTDAGGLEGTRSASASGGSWSRRSNEKTCVASRRALK